MKILLAAPQDETVLGIIGRYCQEALGELGNEVVVFDFRKRPYSSGKVVSRLKRAIRTVLPSLPSPYDISSKFREQVDRKINQQLEELTFKFQPDLLLVLCGENISPGTLEKIRSGMHTVIVNWFHDTLLSPYRQELMQRIALAYDVLFIVDSTEVLKEVPLPAKRVEVLPLACNPQVHKKLTLSDAEMKNYGSDIAFVGTVTPERELWLEELAEFDLKIWGRWLRKSPALKRCYQKKDVYAEEAVKIYNASKIILDFHSLWQKQVQLYNVTPRIFEVPASGGFLLTNPSIQVKDFYTIGAEMVVYRDLKDLKRLISYYLKHEGERRAIAERAYQKARAVYTFTNRLTILLETVRRLGSCPR